MKPKTILLLGTALVLIGLIISVWFLNTPNKSLSSPLSNLSNTKVKSAPSETFKEYIDPVGFQFSYPDNLSLSTNELDDNTYADIQLFSSEVNGSLKLKIVDSQLDNIDEWVKQNTTLSNAKAVQLGNLKAMEITTADRVLLGSLDQQILFTVEVPRIEEGFWMQVYSKILQDFSFVVPESNTGSSADTSSSISFEGEEVVE